MKLIIFHTKMVDSFLGYDFYINLVLFFWRGWEEEEEETHLF